jgi:hypothetical protein
MDHAPQNGRKEGYNFAITKIFFTIIIFLTIDQITDRCAILEGNKAFLSEPGNDRHHFQHVKREAWCSDESTRLSSL